MIDIFNFFNLFRAENKCCGGSGDNRIYYPLYNTGIDISKNGINYEPHTFTVENFGYKALWYSPPIDGNSDAVIRIFITDFLDGANDETIDLQLNLSGNVLIYKSATGLASNQTYYLKRFHFMYKGNEYIVGDRSILIITLGPQ